MQSSKQKLANLENSTTKAKDSRKCSSSGKQNKSYMIGPKSTLPPSAAQNQKLVNATIKAMITQKPATKTNSSSKSKTSAAVRKSTTRAKSACKGGKAEMFNSTAPIKFFSNLEETVREITQGNTNMNLKLNSLSKGRQSYQNRPGKEPYKSIEERKVI